MKATLEQAGHRTDAGSAGEALSGRPGPSAPVVLGVAILYGALALGLAAIGGWVGIAGVFCLAGLVIAGVVVAGSW